MMVLLVLAMAALPLCCSAANASALAVPELDRNFDVDLATTLIIIICSVVTAAILVICIVLAKRNIHN